MAVREIKTVRQPLRAVARAPGSRDMTMRALVASALAGGKSTLSNVLVTDDARCMMDALRSLGVPISLDESTGKAVVSGTGGHWPNGEADLFCGDAAGVLYFVTAACCVGNGAYRIDGAAGLRERPIGPLVDALVELGAYITYQNDAGFAPIHVRAKGLRSGTAKFQSGHSSELISGLLLAAPLASGDIFMELAGETEDDPRLAMTLAVMDAFGAFVVADENRRFIVPGPQSYQAMDYAIEPDAAVATCFLAAPAVVGGSVTIEGLGADSTQGDLGLLDVLEEMGCRVERAARKLTVQGPDGGRVRGVDVDLVRMPDIAPTLAAAALFADGPTRLRNLAPLRNQESDRLHALATELTRLGAQVEVFEDGLGIQPPGTIQPGTVETHDDYRMAMSFALVGLAVDGIAIQDATCVTRTFPDFFDQLDRLGSGA